MTVGGAALWWDAPAPRWLAATPVGNGRLGATVFGRVYKETLILNEETIWTRWPTDRRNAAARAALPEVRRLLLAGHIEEAHTLAELAMFGMPHRQASYQVLGDMTLLFDGHHEERVEGYRRALSLDEGVVSVEYATGRVEARREIFASAPDDVVVVRVEADRAASVEVGTHFYRRYDARAFVDGLEHAVEGRVGERGTRFHSRARVIAENGETSVLGDHIRVRRADAVTIVVAAATDFAGDDPERACRATLDAACARSYDELRARHVEEHRPRMRRVRLRLGEPQDELDALPTDARLRRVQAGQSDDGLVEQYFQFGRYLLVSSSRPGCLPANLQGIWNDSYQPAWDSKFTININTQMNYWPVEVANLSECHEPLFDLIDRLRVSGAETADVHYGCRGFVAHHNTDAWADTAPLDNVLCGLWPAGAAWLVYHLWEHYEYTCDLGFLRERAYPALKEAARFVLDFLIDDPETGELLFGPSVSPENQYVGPDGFRAGLCMSPAGDTQIIRGLFDRCLRGARLLGDRDADLCEELEAALARLPAMRVGRRGQLQEWREDHDEWEPGHRHVSHLFALYPDAQITPRDTPALAAAARRALELRIAESSSRSSGGWSRAWLALLWARLGEGGLALEQLREVLERATETSLLDLSPPGGTNPLTVFQIDGNLGAVAAICELLVQSHDGVVELLPALPPEWPTGSVAGLRARGGFEIQIDWSDGLLERAELRSLAGSRCRVRSNAPLEVSCKRLPVAVEVEDGAFAFATEVGAVYVLQPAAVLAASID